MSTHLTAELDLPIAPAGDYAPTAPASPHDEVLHLFDACAPGLWRHARACGLSSEAAEDVVQDAFLALFRHLGQGGARQNLRGWLVRVSYRLALKHRQRLAWRSRRETEWAAEQTNGVVDAAALIDERMAAHATRRRLRAVFLALPDRDRQCLVLRAEGLRYRDIAATLGISLGLVAKTLARAASRFSNAVSE